MGAVATLERKYYYKTFRNGTYLGLIPNVVSDFNYVQDINTAGTDMTIEIGQVLDIASMAVENITDETGDPITTEAGENITTESAIETIGGKDSGRIIANGNDIQVWEYSDDDPNGVLVFAGYVEKWRSNTDKDTMLLTVVSYGLDLNNYIYGTNIYTLQTSNTGSTSPSFEAVITPAFGYYQAQSISGLSYNLTKIVLKLCIDTIGTTGARPATATLKFYSGTITPGTTSLSAGGTLLATATAEVTNAYPAYTDTDFILSQLVALSGGNYYFTVESNESIGIDGVYDSSNPYAGGQAYYYFGGAWHQSGTDDTYFKLYSSTSVVTDAVFTSYDPAQMVRDAVTGYRAQGGIVSYDGSSVVNSGFTPSYTFRTATILEIINKALELAPYNYYWFVDPATQLLTFKAASATATHKLIMGRHLQSLEIEASIEDITNVIYFTGGPTASVNLLRKYSNTTSLATNRLGMQRLSDNRVVTANAGSADLIAQNYFDGHTAEVFRSSIILPSTVYDLDSINLGDTIGFSGFRNFVDNLILQITRLRRTSDYVELTVGALPLQPNKYIDQINRDLDNQQTLQNPNTPS